MNKKLLIIIPCIIIIIVFVLFTLRRRPLKELNVSFDDNGSTGMKWEYTTDHEGIVDIKTDFDYSGCEGRDGCSGKIIYTVKPLKEGRVKLTFQLKDTSGDIEKTVTYKIEVTKDLKIKETHSSKEGE